MSLPSYDAILDRLGITGPVVWDRDKRTTRSGIRKMLMAAYVEHHYKDPPWYRLWMQTMWVRAQAKEVGVEIPSKLWAEDKARLAAKIAATSDARYPEEKARALRWAQR